MTDDIQRSLGRIESKVETLLDRTNAYEQRIGAVEKKVWYATGASAILAYIATNILGRH